jgi:excisionase family DNA binding protein
MPFDGSLSERLPTVEEVEKAKQATTALARSASRTGALSLRLKQRDNDEAVVELPPAVGKIVLDLLMLISKGEAVTLVPVGAELTTQQAADLLNVSRPFFIKLLETKEIPYHQVGTHRRVRAEDVFTYKRHRDEKRKATLRALARLGQEIDE